MFSLGPLNLLLLPSVTLGKKHITPSPLAGLRVCRLCYIAYLNPVWAFSLYEWADRTRIETIELLFRCYRSEQAFGKRENEDYFSSPPNCSCRFFLFPCRVWKELLHLRVSPPHQKKVLWHSQMILSTSDRWQIKQQYDRKKQTKNNAWVERETLRILDTRWLHKLEDRDTEIKSNNN